MSPCTRPRPRSRHRAPDELLLGFTRALRAAGVPVTADRPARFLAAVALVGSATAGDVLGRPGDAVRRPRRPRRATTRSSRLVRRREQLPRRSPTRRPARARPRARCHRRAGEARPASDDADDAPAAASDAEVLRHRDIARAERRRAGAAATRCSRPCTRGAPAAPGAPPYAAAPRRGRRPPHAARAAAADGRAGPGRATGGRGTRPRRVVLLVDVSGSMQPVRRRAAAARAPVVDCGAAGAEVEVFTIGTRLTRVTRALRDRDPERALAPPASRCPTGPAAPGSARAAAFLDRWGSAGMARGAVVVVFSDGWERGDPRCSVSRCGGCTGWRTGWSG